MYRPLSLRHQLLPRLRPPPRCPSPLGPRYCRPMTSETSPKFIDIGSNLSDPVFHGTYYGKQAHEDDFEQILARARAVGVEQQILTGDCLSGSTQVLELAHTYRGLYATVGCHPCRADEFEAGDEVPQQYLAKLEALIQTDQRLEMEKRRVVAVGECGLDYDRLSYCSKEVQLRHFPPQLELATKFSLPLFLHSRTPEAHVDLVRILRDHHASHATQILPPRLRGVVHSFTGSKEEMEELVELGYSIGINGCSLKTADNLEVVKHIPLDRLMLETDCPWCDIRASHASHPYLADLPPCFLPLSIKKERHKPEDGKIVKGRNEPCTIGQVGWVVAKLMNVPFERIAEVAWTNSLWMFGPRQHQA
ncbi:hypothetical protein CROQUDRAFT_79662 [Cronartium quercuum f. sp. fusiforme G11]|uniref:TatD related DNase n=1 Tax=Cronartium quercuum f. sp. fusiforme G11 TaxID=708437 RepID=A0A9P6NDH6_9BASI|nr:hypothetical protein CROQUDRAFT_79662 [Cronartium quercuum f. sp. fusiforme G11]